MRYRLLGGSGLRVSDLCLGTMTFGEAWGFGASLEESSKVFAAFRDAGGNFIDCANNYCGGESERIVGQLLGAERDQFVVSTKFGLSTDLNDLNAGGNHRKNMRRAVEGSLQRLGTDYIDVYWLHVWDGTTRVEEVLRGLDDLVRAGKVLHIGISDTPAWVVSRANMLAELRGWSSFVGLQVEYSLLERTSERELLPMAQALGLTTLAWAPLGAGLLTGKYVLSGNEVSVHDSLRSDQNLDRIDSRTMHIAETVAGLAQSLDRRPCQVALAWIRQRPHSPIPIVAARTAAQMRENLLCLSLELDQATLSALDAASAIDLGFPGAFLAREQIRLATFGNKQDLLVASS